MREEALCAVSARYSYWIFWTKQALGWSAEGRSQVLETVSN